MQAIKLRTRIRPDHRIELQLPADTPIRDAEVILLIDEVQQEITAGDSLGKFFDQLDQSPRLRLSAEEVDAWIESERNAWE